MMLSKLAEISLKRQIVKDTLASPKQFLPWDKINKIAIILNNAEPINKSSLDKLINDSQKYVEVFFIELQSKQASFGDWYCLTKKDKSFLNLPTKKIISELSDKKFDLVINTCHTNLYASYITSVLKSPIKCGQTSKFNEVQLIINETEPFDLMAYLNNVIKYLKMIKN